MSTGIIVDTSVWVEFFRRPDADITLRLKKLLRERKVVMVGMVLAEILQGVKAPREAGLVRESLEKLPYLETTRAEWEKAGEISASLRKGGITVPLSDLIVAALALSGDLEIFATDPHFEQVRGLRLHNPGLH